MLRRLCTPFAMLIAVASFAGPARASLLLTLDNPNPSVGVPSSGTTLLNFTGTIQIDPGNTVSSLGFDYPFNSSLQGLIGPLGAGGFAATDTVPFVGVLFTIQVPASTSPGLYFQRFAGGSPTFTVGETNTLNGLSTSVSLAYSVNVTGPSLPTPEPSSLAMLISGGLGVVIVWRRKRRLRLDIAASPHCHQ